jgi:hypothetical protein
MAIRGDWKALERWRGIIAPENVPEVSRSKWWPTRATISQRDLDNPR